MSFFKAWRYKHSDWLKSRSCELLHAIIHIDWLIKVSKVEPALFKMQILRLLRVRLLRLHVFQIFKNNEDNDLSLLILCLS